MNLNRPTFTVKDINSYIKNILTLDENLKYIQIKGEISNYKPSANGHIYFSLKDDTSIINCVMFSNYASKLIFSPKNGDSVTILCSIDVYIPRGSYQLFVYEINQDGQGDILLELEKLKKQLACEGLFDEKRKRPINIYPKNIGIITALNSAAIKDIIFNIKRRYPITNILVFPSSVQGDNAPKELLEAFRLSQTYPLDTLIIGRGGGASEDLSAFNDETLVRAIAESKMPVIAAVGHEIDSTLVDFVADKRASTPTGAAEAATVDQREIIQTISYSVDILKNALFGKLNSINDNIVAEKEKMKKSVLNKFNNYSLMLKMEKKHLESLNPKSVFKRGYSISLNNHGEIISSIKQLKQGDVFVTLVNDGKITSKVEDLENGH